MYDRSFIKQSFKDGKIKIKSSSLNGKIEYKKITDVLRHYSMHKNIHKILLKNGKSIIVTEDHSLFVFERNKLVIVKPKDYPDKIVYINNNEIEQVDIVENNIIEKREHTYDLSVEDNENFVLSSGILAHNSFSPPDSEQTIMGFTRTRGYRWPDETLYFHLVQATNYINLIPPDTDLTLTNIPAPWQPLVLLQAMIYALWDLAVLWMNEEFVYSLNGISLDITRSDKYSGAAQALQGQMETQLEGAKRRIHIIRGLAQSKYTFSYGAALGPWVASKMSVKKWVVGSQSGRGFI